MNIGIVKVAALGDVVRTTSIVPALKRRYPRSAVTWFTSKAALPLLEGHPGIDSVIGIDGGFGSVPSSTGFDWVISLEEEPVFCRFVTTLDARKVSGGYADPDGNCRYTPDTALWFGMGKLRPKRMGGLVVANRFKKANTLTFGQILYRMLELPGPIARPDVFVPRETRKRMADWWAGQPVGSASRVVGLNTGAGQRWTFKKWGETQTSELAVRIHDELGAAVIVLGGKAEKERNRRIVTRAGRPRVMAGPDDPDLLEFAVLVGKCSALVTSDSLALHLGAAARVPLIAFFGPTSAAEIDTWDNTRKIITPLDCRCCYLRTCQFRPNCMEAIGPQVMFDAVRETLG